MFAGLKHAGWEAAEFEWRFASGFAHGRPWSSMGLLKREELPMGDDNNVVFRLSSEQIALFFTQSTAFN